MSDDDQKVPPPQADPLPSSTTATVVEPCVPLPTSEVETGGEAIRQEEPKSRKRPTFSEETSEVTPKPLDPSSPSALPTAQQQPPLTPPQTVQPQTSADVPTTTLPASDVSFFSGWRRLSVVNATTAPAAPGLPTPATNHSRVVSFSRDTPIHSTSEVLMTQRNLGIVLTQEIANRVVVVLREQREVVKLAAKSKVVRRQDLKKRVRPSSQVPVPSGGGSSGAAQSSASGDTAPPPKQDKNGQPKMDKDGDADVSTSTQTLALSIDSNEQDLAFLRERACVLGGTLTSFLRRHLFARTVSTIYQLQAEDVQGADWEGYLLLRTHEIGPIAEVWSRYWCILKNHRLFLLPNRTQLHAHRILNLKHLYLDTTATADQQWDTFLLRRCAFFRDFVFRAGSLLEKLRWMELLLKHVYVAWKKEAYLPVQSKFTSADFLEWYHEELPQRQGEVQATAESDASATKSVVTRRPPIGQPQDTVAAKARRRDTKIFDALAMRKLQQDLEEDKKLSNPDTRK